MDYYDDDFNVIDEVDEETYDSDESSEDVEEENQNNEEQNEYKDNIIEDSDEEIEYINDEIILNSEKIKTTKYLTIYERAGIIGERAKELHKQYKKCEFMPFVKIDKTMINKYGELDFIKIAEKELEERNIPLLIKRFLQNNKYVIVNPNELL